MHTAPAVDYPVGRSRVQGLLFLTIGIALAVLYVLWFALADVVGWRHWLGLAVAIAVSLTIAWAWRSAPAGSLCWDGRSWWWESHGVRFGGAVAPALDLQSVVLLRFRSYAGACHWFWLERNAAAMQWDALRRAVAARGHDFGDDALTVQPSRSGESSLP